MSSQRRILIELHEIMNLFRTIFADDKLVCRNIDESYERVLMRDLNLVPVQFDADILKIINYVKLVVTNINFTNIVAGMKSIDPDYKAMGIEFDSYSLAEKILSKVQIDKADKFKINNVMTKLRPIFACVDKIFAMPYSVMTNISNLSNDKYNDLL